MSWTLPSAVCSVPPAAPMRAVRAGPIGVPTAVTAGLAGPPPPWPPPPPITPPVPPDPPPVPLPPPPELQQAPSSNDQPNQTHRLLRDRRVTLSNPTNVIRSRIFPAR